jgi:hypothetical protein
MHRGQPGVDLNWRLLRLRVIAGSVLATLALGLSACGSAATTHAASAPAQAGHTTGTSTAAATTSSPAPGSTACAATVAGTLGQVAARIYHVAATSEDVAQAAHRVQSSTALAAAIAQDNASAARAALRSLLLNQIVAIEVLRGGRPFATAGSGPAIAPVKGSIPRTVASFILSVQSDRSYIQVARQVTGARVLLLTGARAGSEGHRGSNYEVVAVRGAVYPSGALRVALLVPSNAISCPASLAQARVETLGAVGERIYKEELHSAVVSATLRLLEGSQAFKHAVAQESAPAARGAIVGFFREHIHVVRVRVTVRGRVLVDVGGPYVLAPVHGTLRSRGRAIGDFEMAIQDDAGYLKLAHLFTGAEVLMRAGGRQVMGTLSPGPASVPGRGSVTYGGRSYQAYSFTGQAFPSGPLRISLLVP